MQLFAVVLAAVMASAAPHAHSMMHAKAMHAAAMHGKMKSHSMMRASRMHAKMKTHHPMASPTSKP
ncbi:MAG TPA: hypothetical protein VFN37_07255 [Candidatus Baltobacteraceae bacterium]|nr:hypothetical protein [Candidatus Baltobacteraceae bacterium]